MNKLVHSFLIQPLRGTAGSGRRALTGAENNNIRRAFVDGVPNDDMRGIGCLFIELFVGSDLYYCVG